MMVTKRTPINRPVKSKITPEIIDCFRRLRAARDADRDDDYWDSQGELGRLLRLRPWNWPPAHHPEDAAAYADANPNDPGLSDMPRAVELWTELEAAADAGPERAK